MADKKISQLTSATTPLVGTEVMPIVQSGATVQTPVSNVITASSGYTPSGTGAVSRSVSSKLQESVSVKDFGAVGDGITDDTAAIQAAIDASRRIYFPVGTYAIGAPLRLPTQKVLFGDGIGSIIKALPALASATIPTITPGVYSPVLTKTPMLYNSTAIQWWNISNLSFDGDNQDVYGLWLCENFYGSMQGVYIINTLDRPYTNIRGQSIEHIDFVCYSCGNGVVSYNNTNFTFIGGGFERLSGDWFFDQRQPNSFNKGGVEFQNVWFESASGAAPAQGFLRMSGRRNIANIHAALGISATTERSLELNDTTDSRTVDGITMGANACVGGNFIVNNVSGAMFMLAKAGAAYNYIRGWYTVANITDNGSANSWDVNPSLASPVQHVSKRFQVRTPLSISATGYVIDVDDNSGTPIIRLLGNNNNYFDLTSGNLRLASQLGQRFVASSGTINFDATNYQFAGSSGATGYTKPLYFGSFALWVDSSGRLRIKSGAPASDTDGTVVGTQT